MKQYLVALVLLCGTVCKMNAQFSWSSGNKNLQISGYMMGIYNQRFYDADEEDKSKNRFNLDFAVFRLQGITSKRVHYQIQTNFPDLYSTDGSEEFLMQATVEYRNAKDNFSIQTGYDKLPFSRSSQVSMMETPFLQRAETVRGKTFLRRDMGILITKNFFNKKLNLYGGVYTGQGIGSIAGDNDNNGKMLYVARAEMSYPARYRSEEIDNNRTPIPVFSFGTDWMYSEKTETTGSDYPILTVNGKKMSYSGDFSFKYKGFSAHFEYIVFQMTPKETTFLFGKPTNYYRAQGVISHLNYYSEKLKSVFAIRYDEFNPNDLIIGDNRETISFAYNYLFDGMNSALKIHYFKRLKAKEANTEWSEDQIRIGWQIKF